LHAVGFLVGQKEAESTNRLGKNGLCPDFALAPSLLVLLLSTPGGTADLPKAVGQSEGNRPAARGE
jgi:hypothetical protein